MATCNLEYNDELPVFNRAKELNKGVVVKKGLLSGHADTDSGCSGIEEAFKHVLSQPGMSSMVVGTINQQHLQPNVEIAKRYSSPSN